MTTHAHHPGASGHISDYLPAYLNGTLALSGPDAPSSASIAAHLRECPACRQELAAWTAIAHAVPAVSPIATPVTPAPGALDALMAAIDTTPWPQPAPKRSTPAQTPPERPMPDPIALRPPMPSDRWTWTRIRNLGLIAAALILIASVAITSAPDPDPEPPRLPAIAAASPAATATSDSGAPSASVQIVPPTEAIDIAECTTEPRPPGTVAQMREALRGTPEIGLPRSSQAYDWAPSLGWPEPDPETRLGIEETLRQLVACRFLFLPPGAESYDLDNRYLALFSERYVVGLAIEMEGDVSRLPFIPYDSSPLAIVDIAEHEDGRVLVSLGDDLPGFTGTVYVLFEMLDGRWVVDDWADLRFDGPFHYSTPAAALPEPRMPARVTVITTDELGQTWQEPWGEPLPAGTEVDLTVANLSERSIRFESAGLEIAMDVAAGHSADLRVTAPPGTYALDAIPEGGEDLIADDLTFESSPDAPAPPLVDDATPDLPDSLDAMSTPDSAVSVQIVPPSGAIDISECTTEPRPPGTATGLLAAQDGTPLSDAHRYDEVGTEPSAETLAGIDATLRQIVACRYDFVRPVVSSEEGSGWDLDSPTFALYSDEWMTGLAAEMARDPDDGFNVIRTPITPLDSSVLTRQNAIQLRDGSVRVSLRPLSDYGDNPENQPESLEILFILDGRWLVDDYWWEPLGRDREGDTTSLPLTAPAPQAVQVVVADAVVVVYPTSDEVRLSASQDTIVSVANLRDVPLDFAFPTLGFSVTVDPGHSVDLLLTDLVGIHPIDAIPAGGSDLIDSSLILWPDQPSPTPEPQAVATETNNASPYVRIRPQDEAIDSAECTTAPRAPGTVAQLRAAHGGTPEPGIPTSNPLLNLGDFFDPTLDGAESAPETIAAIESTLRQLVACRSDGMARLGTAEYDLDSRHLALFSDRYVVGLAMEMEVDIFRPPFAPYDSAPLPIIAAVDRPEGVLVRLGAVPGYGEQTVHLLMVQENGNWVIDDWANFIVCASPASPPQRAPRATGVEMPQVLPIVATDGFATIWQTPELDPLHAGTDVIITVANLGEAPVRFEIAGLGFATDIAAGHSLDLVVNAPAGTYPLTLDGPGIPDMLDADLTLAVEPSGTPIPRCLPG